MKKADAKHSRLGIASFIISIIGWIEAFMLLAVAGYYEATTPGGMDEASFTSIILGMFLFLTISILLVGTGLGIAGLRQKDQKRIFPILGTILNSSLIVTLIGAVLFGLSPS